MCNRPRGLSAVTAAAACLLTVSALLGAGVELPGTQPADGEGHPDFPRFLDGTQPGSFTDSNNCASCHAGYRQAGEPPYEPWDSWAGSMMAMAGRDPLFWAALDIANQDDAALGGVDVGDLCIRCHSPVGWWEGRSDCTTAWGEAFDGSCLEGDPDGDDNDFDGLTCHFCHRMIDASTPPDGQAPDPAAPYGENAQLYLSTLADVMEGPYADAEPPGRHGFNASAFMRSSAFCGECHDVTNPARTRRDPETGADLGTPMPVERTWSEYRQSAYARPGSGSSATCQSCHMPQPDLDGDGAPDAGFACKNPPGPRGENTVLEGPLRTHLFAGAGAWMQRLLLEEYGESLERTAPFLEAIAASEALLAGRTAEVEIPPVAPAPRGGEAEMLVRVTNLSGHKLPTGYPEGRRAWLRIEAGDDADGDGVLDPSETTFTSGAYDAATGILTKDAQAKIYQVEVGIWDHNGTGTCDLVDAGSGAKMFHFVLNDCIASDNRIPPRGFVPSADTAPVGYSYPENSAISGALAHWDDTAYRFAVAAEAVGPVLVRATLLYQTTSKEYVEFLRDRNRSTCDPLDAGCDPTVEDPRENRGEKMHRLWETHGRAAPVVLATATATVQLVAPSDPPPGEARDLRVTRMPTGGLDLAFTPACDASDHHLVQGPLERVGTYGYDRLACSLGTGGIASHDPGPGSVFFLVVGENGTVEGPYGEDAGGSQRPEATGPGSCDLPRDLTGSCG